VPGDRHFIVIEKKKAALSEVEPELVELAVEYLQ
jgi:hypothetical protein